MPPTINFNLIQYFEKILKKTMRAIASILLIAILASSITGSIRSTRSIGDIKTLAYDCSEHKTGESKAGFTRSIDNLAVSRFTRGMMGYAICDDLISKACKLAKNTCNCFIGLFKNIAIT
jgi:hypothetical protein